MAIEKDLLDRLLADYKKPDDLIGESGLLKQLTKALLERALEAELTDHLGHEKHAPVGNKSGNARNGKSAKIIKGDFGKLPIEVPRDRDATFEPIIIPKGQTRFTGFDGESSMHIEKFSHNGVEHEIRVICDGESVYVKVFQGNRPSNQFRYSATMEIICDMATVAGSDAVKHLIEIAGEDVINGLK